MSEASSVAPLTEAKRAFSGTTLLLSIWLSAGVNLLFGPEHGWADATSSFLQMVARDTVVDALPIILGTVYFYILLALGRLFIIDAFKSGASSAR